MQDNKMQTTRRVEYVNPAPNLVCPFFDPVQQECEPVGSLVWSFTMLPLYYLNGLNSTLKAFTGEIEARYFLKPEK